jgi:hypothetical protein
MYLSRTIHKIKKRPNKTSHHSHSSCVSPPYAFSLSAATAFQSSNSRPPCIGASTGAKVCFAHEHDSPIIVNGQNIELTDALIVITSSLASGGTLAARERRRRERMADILSVGQEPRSSVRIKKKLDASKVSRECQWIISAHVVMCTFAHHHLPLLSSSSLPFSILHEYCVYVLSTIIIADRSRTAMGSRGTNLKARR